MKHCLATNRQTDKPTKNLAIIEFFMTLDILKALSYTVPTIKQTGLESVTDSPE